MEGEHYQLTNATTTTTTTNTAFTKNTNATTSTATKPPPQTPQTSKQPSMALANIPRPPLPDSLRLLLEAPGTNYSDLNNSLNNPSLTPLDREEALKHTLSLLCLQMGDSLIGNTDYASELEATFPETIKAIHDFMVELGGKDLVPKRLGVEGARTMGAKGRGGWVPTMSVRMRGAEVRKAVVRGVRLRERLGREIGERAGLKAGVLRKARARAVGVVEECERVLREVVWEEKREKVRENVRRALEERERGEKREGEGESKEKDVAALAVKQKGEFEEVEGNMKVLALKLKLRRAEGELEFVENAMREEGMEV